jgi:hypothetical protein
VRRLGIRHAILHLIKAEAWGNWVECVVFVVLLKHVEFQSLYSAGRKSPVGKRKK